MSLAFPEAEAPWTKRTRVEAGPQCTSDPLEV